MRPFFNAKKERVYGLDVVPNGRGEKEESSSGGEGINRIWTAKKIHTLGQPKFRLRG